MLRHSEQWRFGVFWQDDGTSSDGQGGGGFGGLGGPAAPATAPGQSGTSGTVGGQSFGGVAGFSTAPAASEGASGAPSGGPGAPGSTTGGGGGIAAGGSAGGPGDGAGGASGGGVGVSGGGSGVDSIAPGFFSSIMGISPANAADVNINQQLNDELQARGFFGGSLFGPSSAFGTPGTSTDLGVPLGVLTGGLANTPVAVSNLGPPLGVASLNNTSLAALAAQLLGPTLGGQFAGPTSLSPTMGFPAVTPTVGVGNAPQGTPAPVGSSDTSIAQSPSPGETVAQQNAAQRMADVEAMAQQDMADSGFNTQSTPATQTTGQATTTSPTAPSDQTTAPATPSISPQDSLMAAIMSLVTGQPPLWQLAQLAGNQFYG